MLEPFEQKALDYYGEVIINKHLIHEAGFGARAIPTYVGEWILSHFVQDGELTEASRERIAAFLGKYLPSKGQKDEIKNRLLKMETIQLLDDFSVSVNLKTGQRHLRIPLLDILNDANLGQPIVDNNRCWSPVGCGASGTCSTCRLTNPLSEGRSGCGNSGPSRSAASTMTTSATAASTFTLDEWLDLMVSSIGFNPRALSLTRR